VGRVPRRDRDVVSGDVAGLSGVRRDHDRTALKVTDGFATDVDVFGESFLCSGRTRFSNGLNIFPFLLCKDISVTSAKPSCETGFVSTKHIAETDKKRQKQRDLV